jgi:hypothetical protein
MRLCLLLTQSGHAISLVIDYFTFLQFPHAPSARIRLQLASHLALQLRLSRSRSRDYGPQCFLLLPERLFMERLILVLVCLVGRLWRLT